MISAPTKFSRRKLMNWFARKLQYLALVSFCGGMLAVGPISNVSGEDSYDRIQAGQWVTASMYWEDKLVSGGKSFNPIGWHAAHKTLPIGTLIRVSNPKNHRSINVTINDRGPFVPDRELDLSLGAGALLGLQGLGTVYMEVLSIPPAKNIQRPIVESLFTVNGTICVVQPNC
jgi:rare lipoprotein A (peptidoglycan hydrolase)